MARKKVEEVRVQDVQNEVRAEHSAKAAEKQHTAEEPVEPLTSVRRSITYSGAY